MEELKLEVTAMQEGWEHERVALQEKLCELLFRKNQFNALLLYCACPSSELAGVGGRELEQKIEDLSGERDSTLQQAQELSDRLDLAEREKDQLQLALENAQNQNDELQFQLDELGQR